MGDVAAHAGEPTRQTTGELLISMAARLGPKAAHPLPRDLLSSLPRVLVKIDNRVDRWLQPGQRAAGTEQTRARRACFARLQLQGLQSGYIRDRHFPRPQRGSVCVEVTLAPRVWSAARVNSRGAMERTIPGSVGARGPMYSAPSMLPRIEWMVASSRSSSALASSILFSASACPVRHLSGECGKHERENRSSCCFGPSSSPSPISDPAGVLRYRRPHGQPSATSMSLTMYSSNAPQHDVENTHMGMFRCSLNTPDALLDDHGIPGQVKLTRRFATWRLIPSEPASVDTMTLQAGGFCRNRVIVSWLRVPEAPLMLPTLSP